MNCSCCGDDKSFMCICQWFSCVKCDTKTHVIVIQDQAELNSRKKWLSSIPILKLVLKNIRVEVVSARQSFLLDINFTDSTTAVLYPSEASIPLPLQHESTENDTSSTCADTSIRTLIVIDGSWISVQNIIAKNPYLQPRHCRHVRLDARIGTSAYEIYGLRKEPARNYLSTAEAVAWALMSIEQGQQASQYILEGFVQFVQLRKAYGPETASSDGSCDDIDTNVKSTTLCQVGTISIGVNCVKESSDGDSDYDLLPSKGRKERATKTKSQKKKLKRLSESRKKRRGK